MLEDFQNFIMGDFGDMEVYSDRLEVECFGNHRLLNDVHNWVQDESQGQVTTVENFDGYDTTTVYQEGVKVMETSLPEEVCV
tara:strand:- start:20 stop:265 length:246 start_codon:yes stop_codon:yes gene_type:complete